MLRRKRALRTIAGALLLFVVFGGGFFTGQVVKTTSASKSTAGLVLPLIGQENGKPTTVDFSRFWQAWQIANTGFYGKNGTSDRVDGAISGMLSSLGDPYTVYLPKEENQLFQTDLSGSFSGIGAELSQINGYPTVVAPLSGSPAEKAGLKAKDVILKIDGKSTENQNFAAAINSIRGVEGTTVTLTVAREGASDALDIKVTRSKIELPNITSEVADAAGFKYGYLKLSEFNQDSDKKVLDVLSSFRKQGVESVVLDLRNNPGGFLDVAIKLGSSLIDTSAKPDFKGTILWQKDRDNNRTPYASTGEATYKGMKLVVLINKGSASASEILAGALSDYGRAKLVGVTSFGKGSVQELRDLPDGSSVKITVAKWLTPAGTEIDHQGIKPDVEVAVPDTQDAASTDDIQRAKAVEVLRTF